MKRNVSHIITAVILLITAGYASTGEQRANISESAMLEMKLSFIDCETPNLGNRKEIQVNAEIRNVGRVTAMLPTKDIGPFVATMGGVGIINFFSDGYLSTVDGFRIPKAKSDLAIVELRPHEAIKLSYVFQKPAPEMVLGYYSIPKEFAQRYGTWTGKIDGGSLSLRTNK